MRRMNRLPLPTRGWRTKAMAKKKLSYTRNLPTENHSGTDCERGAVSVQWGGAEGCRAGDAGAGSGGAIKDMTPAILWLSAGIWR
jgi:hypothetical protein